jgi:hypothetical protein
VNSGQNGQSKGAKIIPDIRVDSLSYVSTDMVLDGGTVLQTYRDAQGGEYTLRFPRKESSAPITWTTPAGDVYSLAIRENQNVLTDFLAGKLAKYRKNWIIYGDIRHALFAVGHMQEPPWNFSSEELDGPSTSQ